jgi:hypothetical protein
MKFVINVMASGGRVTATCSTAPNAATYGNLRYVAERGDDEVAWEENDRLRLAHSSKKALIDVRRRCDVVVLPSFYLDHLDIEKLS